MSRFAISPLARRVAFALAVFTFASWAMLLGSLAAWSAAPSRAANAIARIAHAASATLGTPPRIHAPRAPVGTATCGYAFGSEDGEREFCWALLDKDGNTTGENMNSRRARSGARDGEARFWFMVRGDEFVVRDRAIVEKVRAATRELREQMDAERADHDGSHEAMSKRMSELSARHRDVFEAARAKVREIAERARREGKAERPHANA